MAYTVLARRYRPRSFDEVVGQEPVSLTLRHAVERGRVAHAYLFCGTRGVGKTTMARILASALNCSDGPTAAPCGQCEICRSIHAGEDVDVLEIDGASNTGVDDVRQLRDNAHYRPARARYKIYYIDEVHMLSRNAFNALLKTLEEPPEHVKFIFSTTEPERLPATILSRCQRFDFRAVPTEAIADLLADLCEKEGVEAEKAALTAVAREGRGSIRDALTLLDQAIAVGDGTVSVDAVRETVGAVSARAVLDVVDGCARGDTGAALAAFGGLLAGGADLRAVLDQLIRTLRDLLVVKTCGPEVELLDVFGPGRDALAETAERLTIPALTASLGYLTEAQGRARGSVDGRPVAELALVRMASLAELEALPEVLARLEALERSLAGGGPAPTASASKKNAPPPRAVADETRGGSAQPTAPSRPEAAREPEAPQTESAAPPAPEGGEVGDGNPFLNKALRLFDGRVVGR